eukprot:4348664-Alexandrium_andersonii.AAC.1
MGPVGRELAGCTRLGGAWALGRGLAGLGPRSRESSGALVRWPAQGPCCGIWVDEIGHPSPWTPWGEGLCGQKGLRG